MGVRVSRTEIWMMMEFEWLSLSLSLAHLKKLGYWRSCDPVSFSGQSHRSFNSSKRGQRAAEKTHQHHRRLFCPIVSTPPTHPASYQFRGENLNGPSVLMVLKNGFPIMFNRLIFYFSLTIIATQSISDRILDNNPASDLYVRRGGRVARVTAEDCRSLTSHLYLYTASALLIKTHHADVCSRPCRHDHLFNGHYRYILLLYGAGCTPCFQNGLKETNQIRCQTSSSIPPFELFNFYYLKRTFCQSWWLGNSPNVALSLQTVKTVRSGGCIPLSSCSALLPIGSRRLKIYETNWNIILTVYSEEKMGGRFFWCCCFG